MRVFGLLVFFLGVLLGIFLTVSAAWADLEAIFYGFDSFGGKSLSTLHCPVFMTTTETGRVSVTLRNPEKKKIEPLLRADFSSPGPYRQVKIRLPLEPGEKKTYTWTVTKEDVDLGFFILVKVFTYAAASLPFQEATCGILVLNLPGLTGQQVLIASLGLMILGLIFGLVLWQSSYPFLRDRSLEVAWAMRLLAGVILLGVLSSLKGWLLIGILMLILSILLISVFIYFIATARP